MDTEVFGIQEESSAGIEVGQTVGTDLFGNGAGIFAEITCNVFERGTGIQLVLNIKSVCSSKMLMVTRNIFTHDVSFYCRQTQRHHNMYAELKSTYAEVISIGETEGRIYFCNLGGCLWFLLIIAKSPLLVVSFQYRPWQ